MTDNFDDDYGDEVLDDEDTFCSCGRPADDCCGFCGEPLCYMCYECGAGFCNKEHTQEQINEYARLIFGDT